MKSLSETQDVLSGDRKRLTTANGISLFITYITVTHEKIIISDIWCIVKWNHHMTVIKCWMLKNVLTRLFHHSTLTICQLAADNLQDCFFYAIDNISHVVIGDARACGEAHSHFKDIL